MNQNNHFDMRYKKITWEAILKSLFYGLIIAFGVTFVLGAVFWIIGTRNLGLVIGLLSGALVLVTGVAGAIFYFAKFHPTVKSNARRIDTLGLEERVITMIEFKDDDSVIANLQRNDALSALETVNEKLIRFNFGKGLMTALSIAAALSLPMNIVASLSAAGFIPSFSDIIQDTQQHVEYIPVSYMAEDGGYIEGETDQLILFGDNAESVVAIPEEGYTFEGWDDGYKKPTRTDEKIDKPLVLTAIFMPIEDEEDAPDDGESGENGEAPGDEEGEGDQQGDGDTPGDNPGSGGDPSERDQNYIIDGTEDNDYKKILAEGAKDDVIKFLKENIDRLTEEERAIIEAYINIL